MNRYALVFTSLLLLTACGQQEIEEGEHVWKDQVHTMDNARGVEDTLKDAEQKRRDAAAAQADQ